MAVADCGLLEYGGKERGLSGSINCVGVRFLSLFKFILLDFSLQFGPRVVVRCLLGVTSLNGSLSIKIDFFTLDNMFLVGTALVYRSLHVWERSNLFLFSALLLYSSLLFFSTILLYYSSLLCILCSSCSALYASFALDSSY